VAIFSRLQLAIGTTAYNLVRQNSPPRFRGGGCREN
jgi:hypothetical protein